MTEDLPPELAPLWAALRELLDTFAVIQDRLDPTLLDTYRNRLTAPTHALEGAVAPWNSPNPLRGPPDRARELLLRSATQALTASARFQEAKGPHAMLRAFQALRPLSRAADALFRLSDVYTTVSEHFLRASATDSFAERMRATDAVSGDGNTRTRTGVLHADNGFGQRGGYSLHVPDYYSDRRAWPLIVALHGGSGHGADMLWSWLRDARSFGFLLAAPTSRGRTWSLQSPSVDAANLNRMLEEISGSYRVDTKHLLLTGISDGGTFAMILSIVKQSPFTHYAPVAAAVHVLQSPDGTVKLPVSGLPVYHVHGARDWMFPVQKARAAAEALRSAGANIVYREIPDLSHNYPTDENEPILRWFYPPAFGN